VRQGWLLRVLIFCVFAAAIIVSVLVFEPSSVGTKLSPEKSVVDYVLLAGLWGTAFTVVYMLGRKTVKAKVCQLLDTVATGLSSVILSMFALSVYPELSGNNSSTAGAVGGGVSSSQELFFTLPVLLTITVVLFWLSKKLENNQQQPVVVEQQEEVKV
jgi:hypothetical protein